MSRSQKMGLLGVLAALLVAWFFWPSGEATRGEAERHSWFSRTASAPALRTLRPLASATASDRPTRPAIHGLVIDAVSGAPIQAEVRLLGSKASGGTELDSVTCDAQGHFAFPPGDHEVATVAAKAKGYSVKTAPLTGEDLEIRLALDRSVRVSGRVVDPAGKGIDGALVVVISTEYIGEWPTPQSEYVTTLADGRFDIPDAPAGRMQVRAEKPGKARGSKDLPSTGPGQTVEGVEIVLGEPASLLVRVHAEGKPVDGAAITVRAKSSSRYVFETSADMARPTPVTGADGTCRIADVPPGPTQVGAVSGEGIGGTEVTVPEGGEATAEIEMVAGGSIEGVVVDDGGGPINAAQVYATTREDSARRVGPALPAADPAFAAALSDRRIVSADREGRFRLGGLMVQTWRLRVSAEHYSEVSDLPATLGEKDLRVVLERPGSVQGVVYDPAGRPWKGSGVVKGQRQSRLEIELHDGEVGEDGHFLFEDISAGEWILAFRPPGADSGEVRALVKPGETATADLHLKSLSGVRGRVVSAGKPVVGAKVGYAFDTFQGRSVQLAGDSASRTDDQGRFEAAVPPGEATLMVYHPEYKSVTRTVQIPVGDTFDVGEIEMVAGVGQQFVPSSRDIGLLLEQEGESLVVEQAWPTRPAAQAGVQAGDVLTAINGASTSGMSVDQAEGSLLGRPGSTVTLSLLRDGTALQIAVTRN